MKCIAVAVNGSPSEKQRELYKYYIDVSDKWDDYGYRTLCKLYRIMGNKEDIFIGYLRCFNYCGEIGSIFYHPSTSSRCFITDYETAYRMILYSPKDERLQLISELHIGQIFNSEITKPIFIKSIMRGLDSDEFLKSNKVIKTIINTEVDVTKLLITEKSSLEKLFKSTEQRNI